MVKLIVDIEKTIDNISFLSYYNYTKSCYFWYTRRSKSINWLIIEDNYIRRDEDVKLIPIPE